MGVHVDGEVLVRRLNYMGGDLDANREIVREESGLSRLADENADRQRRAIIRALYARGDLLCLASPKDSDDAKLGNELRYRASELTVKPWRFLDMSLENWGWLIAGFTVVN